MSYEYAHYYIGHDLKIYPVEIARDSCLYKEVTPWRTMTKLQRPWVENPDTYTYMQSVKYANVSFKIYIKLLGSLCARYGMKIIPLWVRVPHLWGKHSCCVQWSFSTNNYKIREVFLDYSLEKLSPGCLVMSCDAWSKDLLSCSTSLSFQLQISFCTWRGHKKPTSSFSDWALSYHDNVHVYQDLARIYSIVDPS